MSIVLGTLMVGRLALQEYRDATFDAGSMSVSARESSVIGAALVRARHTEVLELEGQVLPVVAQFKPEMNGFYEIDRASSKLTFYPSPVNATFVEWELGGKLVSKGNTAEVETHLTGSGRQTDHALAAERWHSPAIGHTAHHIGAETPGLLTRATPDGNITVYRAFSGRLARWSVPLGSYLAGAPSVTMGGVLRTGTNAAGTTWLLSNGLLQVRSSTSNTFEVSAFNGTWGAWKTFNVQTGGTNAFPISAVSILRNDPSEVGVRLVHSLSAGGRVTIDISLRRGARFAHVVVQRHAAATLAVTRTPNEAATSLTGAIRATSNDGDGNRYVIGSARTFTSNLTSGTISKASAVYMDAFVGMEVGGSGAGSGNLAADLMAQYLGMPAVHEMVVSR